MRYSYVAAALVGSAVAAQHKAHAGFHMRRHAANEVCTVYTTVYETAMPSMAPNSTMAVPPTVPETTSCTEEGKTSMYTPVVPASTEEAHKPSSPVPVVPASSMPSYPAVPESTKPAVPEVPMSSTPAYPAVPESSKPVVPAVPESSTTCTEEEGKTSSMEAPKPTSPAPVPEHSTPAVPAVPETSTTCTEEEGKPTGPAPVPESSKPAYPSVPEVTKPAVPAVPESSKPAYPSVPEQSKPAVPEVPEVSKPAYTPAVPSSSKEAEKPKPTPSTSKGSDKPKPTGSYNNGEHIVTNGEKWAITYTPYANSGDCKTPGEISADIKKIHELGFTTIRSYSTDCGVFEHVVPECTKYGLKVIYGIFLEAGGKGGRGPFSSYANDQLTAIKENAPKDSVAMVIVGNECVFNGNCDVHELGSYLDYVRDELRGAGFPSDVAITTAETVGSWEENGAALCAHIDIFTVQIHPYFTQSVTAEMAGEFAAQQLEQAAKVCPEAAVNGKFISEIGWPSAGDTNGLAVAGVQQQKTAMKTIMENVGPESCLFSFQNDGWKEPGALNVEQNFGCVDSLLGVFGLSINIDVSL